MILAAAILVAAALVWAGQRIAGEIRAARDEGVRGRALALAQVLAPGLEAAQRDPRALLVWQPLAETLRRLMPAACDALDKAAGERFPFTTAQIEAAHARWTADWLMWERTHDAEYKARAVVAEQELAASGGSVAARARVEGIEREKLELYQRRYQEYVQIAKALQGLGGTPAHARTGSGDSRSVA